MNIIVKKVSEIFPYENNTKKHDKKQIDNVAESIKQYGFVQPVVIDKDGVIVIGHCRVLAAKKLKMKEVPCVCVDDLTPEQVNALRIVDNKTNESEWDFDLLTEEFAQVDLSDFDFDFDLDLNLSEDEEQKDIIEDEAPEVDEESEPITKFGDIWQLGRHRLMCGDSTDRECVEKLMNGNKADMVFTDPPYGYEYQSNMRKNTDKFDVIKNDDKILDFFPNVKKFCNGFVFVCTTWKVIDIWIEVFKKYHNLTNMIIWDKGGGGMGDLDHTFSTDYEIILCDNQNKKITGKRLGSVWKVGKDNADKYVHPTQKPVGLSSIAINNCTSRNDNILDLFGGSGSTLIACEQLDRICYTMELDPKYCDVIIQRWENFTGEKAIKLN